MKQYRGISELERMRFHYGKNEDCLGIYVDELPLEAVLFEALRPESDKDTRESRRLIFYFYSQTLLSGRTPPRAISSFIANLLVTASEGRSIDQFYMPPTQNDTDNPSEKKSRTEARWSPSPAYVEALRITEMIYPHLPRDMDTNPISRDSGITSYNRAGETLAKVVPGADYSGKHPAITASKLKSQIRWHNKRIKRLTKVQSILDQFYAPEGLGMDKQLELASQAKALYTSLSTE